jgi:hypothetical protein
MDPFEKMHQRDCLRMLIGPINDIMEKTPIAESDLHKYFVMNPDQTTGQIMDHAAFLAMEIGDIGGWTMIGSFHINQR